MRPPPTKTAENADAVGHVIALLVRFPEIATIASHPTSGSIVLSFVVGRRLDGAATRSVRDAVSEHVRTLLATGGEEPGILSVTCELDERVTFVRVARDAPALRSTGSQSAVPQDAGSGSARRSLGSNRTYRRQCG